MKIYDIEKMAFLLKESKDVLSNLNGVGVTSLTRIRRLCKSIDDLLIIIEGKNNEKNKH